MASAQLGGVQALGALDSQLAEVEDILAYCSDVLATGVEGGKGGVRLVTGTSQAY